MSPTKASIYIIMFLYCICSAPNPLHAAFPAKDIHIGSMYDSSVTGSASSQHSDLPRSETSHRHVPGFLAYFAVGCGVVGLLTIAIPSTLLMTLFGLAAGVAGKMGLKRYKHDKVFKAMCYVGIGLGALLVILATIPILLLL